MSELFGHSKGAFTDAADYRLGLFLEASGYQTPAKTDREKARKDNMEFIDWLKLGNKALVDPKREEGCWQLPPEKQQVGTLFLDEIGALPERAMAGVLRALEGDIRPLGHSGQGIQSYCRIIAATNEYEKLVNDAGFRQDLLYRLSGAVLRLLPLSKRGRETIDKFVASMDTWNSLGISPPLPVDDDAVSRIWSIYEHPANPREVMIQKGNFRTLGHLIHRSALLAAKDGRITEKHVEHALEHGYVQVEEEKNLQETPSTGTVKPVDQAMRLSGLKEDSAK